METATHQSADKPDKPHVLLTSLGKQAIPTKYQWGERTVKASLTPLALVQFLNPKPPTRVVAVVTEGAKAETWPKFQQGINATLGFDPDLVSIPDGSSSDEIGQILEQVSREIPEGAELTLDVTQGLRHFPFIFYALVLYLKSLRSVTIRGAYYGMIEGTPPSEPKPIIDLQPLLDLPEWFYAVRMFRDQGTTSPIAALIKPLAKRLNQQAGELFRSDDRYEGKERSTQAKQVKAPVEWLEKYAFAYESALPLELGKASWGLSDSIQNLATMNFAEIPPLADELTCAIAKVADRSAFAQAPSKGDWKKTILINKKELKRQTQMIDLYLDRDQLPLAVGLMREWVVSWAMLQSGQTVDWLNRSNRQRYERRLGALGAFARHKAFKSIVTAEQKEFGTFWHQLTDELRNALHHHGMRKEALEDPPKSLKSVRDFWDRLKADQIDWPLLGGGKGQVLISPQGTRPGVLFSALKVAQPDACLVICSAASASSIADAAKHAGFKGHIERIELTDPHGGFDEIEDAVEQARPDLLNADKVIANMTGGTTLMGLIVQRLTEEAQKLDRPVRRFALIDRRPPAEQDSDPFVQGDCHWLDPEHA